MRNINIKNKSLQETLDSVEKEMVKKSLIKYKWNISKAAKELKITRVRLYHIINKNNLENIKK